jgi:hypothetical protein
VEKKKGNLSLREKNGEGEKEMAEAMILQSFQPSGV